VVRRVLAAHYRPEHADEGLSWLTLLSQSKDSLWSVNLFRAESILLKSHWVLVIMDVCTRRIIGFGVQAVAVDGPALCRIFNQAIFGQGLPIRLSLDHDPLFQFHRWQANLRILRIESVPTVPYVPVSNPFIERLIGTIRPCLRLLLVAGWLAAAVIARNVNNFAGGIYGNNDGCWPQLPQILQK